MTTSRSRILWLAAACVWAAALSGCPEKKAEPPAPAPAPVAPPTPTPEPAAAQAHDAGSELAAAGDAGAAQAGAKGAIEGEVVFSGTPPKMQPLNRGADPACNKGELMDESILVKDGKLANVVVRITRNAPSAPAPSEPVVIDQQGCVYHPRVSAVVKGQKLQIKNSDGTLHNVHAYVGTKTAFNQAQPPRAAAIQKEAKGGQVLKLKCDVHPWMTAYVVESDNPFFAITGEDGKFAIPDLPPGTYTVEAWHEHFGAKPQEVTVKAGEPVKITFTYSPSDRG